MTKSTTGWIYDKSGKVKKVFAPIYAAMVSGRPEPQPAIIAISKKIKNKNV